MYNIRTEEYGCYFDNNGFPDEDCVFLDKEITSSQKVYGSLMYRQYLEHVSIQREKHTNNTHTDTHTDTHTHTFKHTHTHTHTHTLHTHTHTHARARTHACTRAHTHVMQ